MHARIVVPLDGSAFGKRAIPLALALARRGGAAVELVHVHEPAPTAAGAPALDLHFDRAERERMRRDVLAIATDLGPATGVEVVASFLDGEIVPTLRRHLADEPAQLVVMMTHGRGGLSRIWLGSVADGLTRVSPVPVLLLRAGIEWPGELREPFFRRVLIPVDDADVTEAVVPHLVALATPARTTALLLTVVDPRFARPVTAVDGEAAGLEREAAADRVRHAAEQRLGSVARALRERGVETAVDARFASHPAPAILTYAEEHEVDLIVVAASAQDAFGRPSLGATVDKVVRGATVPLLVVHAGERVATLTP